MKKSDQEEYWIELEYYLSINQSGWGRRRREQQQYQIYGVIIAIESSMTRRYWYNIRKRSTSNVMFVIRSFLLLVACLFMFFRFIKRLFPSICSLPPSLSLSCLLYIYVIMYCIDLYIVWLFDLVLVKGCDLLLYCFMGLVIWLWLCLLQLICIVFIRLFLEDGMFRFVYCFHKIHMLCSVRGQSLLVVIYSSLLLNWSTHLRTRYALLAVGENLVDELKKKKNRRWGRSRTKQEPKCETPQQECRINWF